MTEGPVSFVVRTLVSLPMPDAPVPQKSDTGYPWVFRPDLAKYREFHLKLLLTDRVYLALKKIENSEKIPAEQILLCGLIQPSAPNDDKTSSPSDGAKGEVKQRMPSMVKLDDPNKSLIDYGLEENSVLYFTLRSLVEHPSFDNNHE